MSGSTITLQNEIDRARTWNELIPVLSAAGSNLEPAATCAEDTLREMTGGYRFPDGSKVGPFPMKWNRMVIPPFVTNNYQQDYATIDLKIALPNGKTSGLQWLENGVLLDINNTGPSKPLYSLTAVRDLPVATWDYRRPVKVCWFPNDQLQYGTWGGANATIGGSQNPGPNKVFTNPLGSPTTPPNPITQIQDPNGNYLILTTYGTCGSSAPSFPAAGAAAGVTVTDGSCVWTVVNPKAPGFRLWPRPPQSAVTYTVNLFAQMKPVGFTALGQTLDPVPDDMEPFFRRIFIAHLFEHAPEAAVRGKAQVMLQTGFRALEDAASVGDREQEAYGMVAAVHIMDGGWAGPIGPAWPFQPVSW